MHLECQPLLQFAHTCTLFLRPPLSAAPPFGAPPVNRSYSHKYSCINTFYVFVIRFLLSFFAKLHFRKTPPPAPAPALSRRARKLRLPHSSHAQSGRCLEPPAAGSGKRAPSTTLPRPHTSAYVSIRQHASACVSIRQHASACVSIRQHTSAYGSIRQHTSAYVSIRQHTQMLTLVAKPVY